MPNNKKKKGGNGSRPGSSRQAPQNVFPSGDFDAQPGGPAPAPARGAPAIWHDDTATGSEITGKSPDEIIALSSPCPRLRETADPDAAAHLEAHELFCTGIRCGRHGDLDGAKTQIASAFLLDDRSLQVWLARDPVPRADVPLLDYPLLHAMLSHDKDDSIADAVLKVAFAFTEFASMSGQAQEMDHVQRAAMGIDAMVKMLERTPSMEGDGVNGESGPLGGLFRRCRLWEIKASLMLRIGNAKESQRCLTKALEACPEGGDCYEARLSRALLWAATQKKDAKVERCRSVQVDPPRFYSCTHACFLRLKL